MQKKFRTRSDTKSDTKNKRRLRDPLEIGELVSVLAEISKENDTTGTLHKSTRENRSFLIRMKSSLLKIL